MAGVREDRFLELVGRLHAMRSFPSSVQSHQRVDSVSLFFISVLMGVGDTVVPEQV